MLAWVVRRRVAVPDTLAYAWGMMTTADKLRALAGAGLTQTRIATLTGSTQPTISRVLGGTQRPLEPLVRAVDALYEQTFGAQEAA